MNIENINDLSYFLLSKESETYKCSSKKKCPCRTWINCKQYIDTTEQLQRIERKINNTSNKITEWYNTQFKLEISMINSYCSSG